MVFVASPMVFAVTDLLFAYGRQNPLVADLRSNERKKEVNQIN